MMHIVPYAVDSGMTSVQAATLLTLIGISGIGGRLLSGLISDKTGIKPVMVFCLTALAVITLWIAFSNDTRTFYIFAAVYGITYSGFVTMMVRIARQIFGMKSLGSIFGALMVSDGIGFGVGPWLAGYIFDITGEYQISFIAVTAGLIAATAITIIIKPPSKKHTRWKMHQHRPYYAGPAHLGLYRASSNHCVSGAAGFYFFKPCLIYHELPIKRL